MRLFGSGGAGVRASRKWCMPRHVAATHAAVMAAPAMYGCPVTRAPAAVPESSVAARPSVSGKWQGQITNAPITQARPRLSVCAEDVGTGHTGPLVLIATALGSDSRTCSDRPLRLPVAQVLARLRAPQRPDFRIQTSGIRMLSCGRRLDPAVFISGTSTAQTAAQASPQATPGDGTQCYELRYIVLRALQATVPGRFRPSRRKSRSQNSGVRMLSFRAREPARFVLNSDSRLSTLDS